MKNFPKIKTKRLLLDQLHLRDSELITNFLTSEKMSQYTLNIPFPYKESDAIYWINSSFEKFNSKKGFVFGMYLKDDFIGAIDLSIDSINQRVVFGYWVAENYWNNGYMTEGLIAIIEFIFTTKKINKIYAHHLIENISSGKVMQKAGMIKEGELKEHNLKNGVFRSLYQYRILRSEYNKEN